MTFLSRAPLFDGLQNFLYKNPHCQAVDLLSGKRLFLRVVVSKGTYVHLELRWRRQKGEMNYETLLAHLHGEFRDWYRQDHPARGTLDADRVVPVIKR